MENNQTEKSVFVFKSFIEEYMDVRRDKADESEAVKSIREGVEMKGATIWILIAAILLASLGLNVNSTAVIIGAMLISPLMGPIMGVGLAIGLGDFDLMKRSFKNYLVITLFSVVTATLFFLISPSVSEGQSELLARTSPTIYDVFIALFGGAAGFIALSTTKKGSVIPGVAIATALMPPLCTAGFGLATGNLLYFLGAFYLYFINSVFICVATFLGTRFMRFSRLKYVDKEREKKVRKYIVWVVVLTMIPAVYLTYGILNDTIYEGSVNRFVNEQLSFENAQVVDKKVEKRDGTKELRVVLVGKEVADSTIIMAQRRMADYNLGDTKLVVLQGVSGQQAASMDITSVRAQVLEDFYKNGEVKLQQQAVLIDSIQGILNSYLTYDELARTLMPEMKVLYPQVTRFSLSRSLEMSVDSARADTVTFAIIHLNKRMDDREKAKMVEWMKARTNSKELRLLLE
ncbi:MAG: TIGR00341 family protein [Bacteroidaceae bacterium]|jgi:uncharacterized hydrophobic protein (TIGR00271 family)|nr:TIGR00341 family protein [Bacteroidaceae bacterium]MBP3832470.1 TIGR00341 family protein [Bacteroidaceae bacterium]MBQ9674918.1 TIGR00341 family protein [Bacteroidaceae bacterium]